MRDVISTEMWEALNAFYLLLGRYDLPAALRTGPYSFYQEVKENCALFWGLLDRTMLHDEGRAFLEAGGRIEEADMVAADAARRDSGRLVGGGLGRPRRWRCCTPSAASRPTGGRSATPRPSDRWFASCCTTSAYPSSVASSVEALAAALSAADAQPRSSPPVLRLSRLIADLELQRRAPDDGGDLQLVLERVQDELLHVDRDIDARYFAVAALAAVHL